MEKQNELLINEAKSNNLAFKSNKQIEEMAKHCHFYYDGNCTLCEELWVECDNKCDMCEFAKRLYNACYRKASEVAREIFEDIEKVVNYALCVDLSDWSEYTELKKKYIGEDINVTTNTEEGK